MGFYVKKLVSICGDELSTKHANHNCSVLTSSSVCEQLKELLAVKNGFYGFESALHVFPYESTDEEIGLLDWNEKSLWIAYYNDMALDAFYFAEDVFGSQFCVRNDGIYSFDPETADFSKIAETINDWCHLILNDYNILTGYSLAHSWQKLHGAIPPGHRLVPKIPFVTGGEYDIENLYLECTYKSLIARANLALQIRDIPDGNTIKMITQE
ncbi:SMI1/KNR4 family protein [Lelliottia wanjuensis]|uniref:SMI1/KNR4 family protein n=1 Tax=Lelliottia wanjuensis TaxID=3050585 RepID=UPI002551B7AE|nr:SMI1/KNR4 family protein [Lelliottia sp. V104_15]MDK9607392.1 SMI1/KNR4 family protein [Lelliottia sp. V104_15]